MNHHSPKGQGLSRPDPAGTDHPTQRTSAPSGARSDLATTQPPPAPMVDDPAALSEFQAAASRALETPLPPPAPWVEASLPIGTQTTAPLVDAILAHAQENYAKDWDVVVETMSRAEISETIKNARSLPHAIKIMTREVVGPWRLRQEHQADLGAGAFPQEPEAHTSAERFTQEEEAAYDRHLAYLEWQRTDSPTAYLDAQTDVFHHQAQAEGEAHARLFKDGKIPEGVSYKALVIANTWQKLVLEDLGAMLHASGCLLRYSNIPQQARPLAQAMAHARTLDTTIGDRWLGDRKVSGLTSLEALQTLVTAMATSETANGRPQRLQAIQAANETLADAQGLLRSLEDWKAAQMPLTDERSTEFHPGILRVGDLVAQALVEAQAGTVAPTTYTDLLLQVGLPASEAEGVPLFPTFIRDPLDRSWRYRGVRKKGSTSDEIGEDGIPF